MHCKGKIICNICIFPTRNWYIYWIILEDTIYMRKDNLQHLYIYLQETDTFIGMRIFPTVHHQKLLCLQRNPHYYPRIFYQFMYTNQYFLNTTLISSDRQTDRQTDTHTHIHAHMHTSHTYHWEFHFHLWTFASQTWSLAISIIWNIWMSDDNSPQKSKAKLKTVINKLN